MVDRVSTDELLDLVIATAIDLGAANGGAEDPLRAALDQLEEDSQYQELKLRTQSMGDEK